jgi:hypothetical protein
MPMKKSVQKWMNQLVFFVAPLLGAFLPIRASAGFNDIKLYPQKVWDIQLTGRYLTTNSNFTNAGGSFANVPAGYSYSLDDFNLAFRTSVDKKNWAFWGDTQLSYAQSKSPAQSLTNASVTHARIGTDYIFFQDSFALIPEFFFLYPITTNTFSNTNTVAISDGTMVASGKLYLRVKVSNLWMEGFAGYQYRDQGRSSLIPYGIVGEYLFHNWSVGANLQGYSSGSSDANTNNPTQQYSWMNTVNGASQIFDGLNPQLLETNVWVKFHTSKKFSFFFGAGDTINGANTANYWDIQAGIAYHLPSSQRTVRDPIENQDQFDEEVSDGVDQRLFDKSNTPGPVATPANRSRPSTAQPQNIQKELDKAEMQIELKAVKKKNQKTDQDN